MRAFVIGTGGIITGHNTNWIRVTSACFAAKQCQGAEKRPTSLGRPCPASALPSKIEQFVCTEDGAGRVSRATNSRRRYPISRFWEEPDSSACRLLNCLSRVNQLRPKLGFALCNLQRRADGQSFVESVLEGYTNITTVSGLGLDNLAVLKFPFNTDNDRS